MKSEVCEGCEHGNSIQLKTLRAHAVKSLIQEVGGELGHCQYKEAMHSNKITEAEVLTWLSQPFKNEPTVRRRQLEEQLGLSRYMAVKYLKQFVSEGKLSRPGFKNDSVYLPVEGAFE